MRSTLSAAIVIVCPHCGTRYQVPPEAIGAGRKVSCARCGQTWTAHQPRPATPEEEADELFAKEEEAELDATFRAVERGLSRPAPAATTPVATDRAETLPDMPRSVTPIRTAIAPGTLPAIGAAGGEGAADRMGMEGRVQRRQRSLAGNLPTSRQRSMTRLASLSALLAVLALGYGLRVEIVRAVPDLAGVYAALGMTINVVGLDFSGLSTLIRADDGGDVLRVEASIFSVETREVAVPPILISLFDAEGRALYAWSVAPPTATLAPGESLAFSAELARPPAGAMRATLSFAGSARPIDPAGAPAAPMEAAPHHG